MKLIAWLLSIAQDHRGSDLIDIKGWVARPLVVQPLQTNGYDCGLWVLTVIAVVL
jgi:Ulp1 family protease